MVSQTRTERKTGEWTQKEKAKISTITKMISYRASSIRPQVTLKIYSFSHTWKSLASNSLITQRTRRTFRIASRSHYSGENFSSSKLILVLIVI